MSERDLIYRVRAEGVQATLAALATVQGRVRRMAEEEAEIAKGVARTKSKTRDDEARHVSSVARTQIAFERARAKEEVASAERAERAKVAAVKREAQQRERIALAEMRATIKARNDEVKAFERAEREKTRIADREQKARERQERVAAERSARQAQREFEREFRDRAFDQKRLMRSFGTGFAEGGIGAVRYAGRAAMGLGKSIATGAGLHDTFDVAGIVRQEFDVNRTLRAIAVEARKAGDGWGGFNEAQGKKQFQNVAAKWGISQSEAAGAVGVYSNKGSGATGLASLDEMATLSVATGASMEDIARVRATMEQMAEQQGKPLSPKQMQAIFGKMAAASKVGTFTFKEFAAQAEPMLSSFAQTGDFEKGFNEYYNFAQLAHKNIGNSAMARTAITAIGANIKAHAPLIQSMGISTLNEDGTDRAIMEVVKDMVVATGGNTGDKRWMKVFNAKKEGKAANPLAQIYAQAERKQKGSGKAAMEGLLAGDASLEKASWSEVEKDAKYSADTDEVKLKIAKEQARQKIADALVPALVKLAEVAPKLASAFSTLVDFASNHPALAAAGAMGGAAVLGGSGGLAKGVLGGIARFAGDSVVKMSVGKGGKLGAIGGIAGGMLSQAGSTPVYITGAAPGVNIGGGIGGAVAGAIAEESVKAVGKKAIAKVVGKEVGVGLLTGGAGMLIRTAVGGGGAGGAGTGAGTGAGAGVGVAGATSAGFLGTAAPLLAGTIGMTAIVLTAWELWKTTDAYRKAHEEAAKKTQADNDAIGNKPKTDDVLALISGRGEGMGYDEEDMTRNWLKGKSEFDQQLDRETKLQTLTAGAGLERGFAAGHDVLGASGQKKAIYEALGIDPMITEKAIGADLKVPGVNHEGDAKSINMLDLMKDLDIAQQKTAKSAKEAAEALDMLNKSARLGGNTAPLGGSKSYIKLDP